MSRRSSREIVLDTFARRPVERVPKWFGSSPEFIDAAIVGLGLDSEEELRRFFDDDFRRVGSVYRGPSPPLSEGATWRSPFGVERIGLFYGEPKSHPLLGKHSLDDLRDYPWPSSDWADTSGIPAATRRYGGEYAILGGEWSPFWHDAIDLVGMEDLYYLMYDDPEYVDLLFTSINDYYLAASEKAFREEENGIDIYFIGNDFGGQTGPLLGPALFRRYIVPQLRRHVALARRYGKRIMLHCCGGFRPLIPLLIEAGIDALHALQPDCTGMDPAELKAEFGERIVLNGAIDSKSVLIRGSEEDVRRETARILELMSPGGGYIAGASHDYILPETPLRNVQVMFETIRGFRGVAQW